MHIDTCNLAPDSPMTETFKILGILLPPPPLRPTNNLSVTLENLGPNLTVAAAADDRKIT